MIFKTRKDLEGKAWYRILIVFRYLTLLFLSIASIAAFLNNLNSRVSEESDRKVALVSGGTVVRVDAEEVEYLLGLGFSRATPEDVKKFIQASYLWAALSLLILPFGLIIWVGVEKMVVYVINGPESQSRGP